MDINAEVVREARAERGWTQQHLADAAGLSLRTIQRIENQAVASNESLSALCAVFELERSTLLTRAESASPPLARERRLLALMLAAATAGAAVGAAVTLLLVQ